MINVSDNSACNNLISAVGMSNVNEFAAKNGYKATQLNRKMLVSNGKENYTSAADCGKMLEKVLKGTYVSKHASERILEKGLKAQQRRSKIPAGVPSGVETANKTGELNNVWWCFPIAEVMSLIASAFFLRRSLQKMEKAIG